MIRHRNFDPSSMVRSIGRTLQILTVGSSPAYMLAATAASAMTVGTALTLLQTLATIPHSIAFTSGAAQTSAFSFAIIGENQFGETVAETVTTTGANAVNHSLYCYRRIISITPTAKSSTGTDTVSIGSVISVASGTPKIPLPCKPTAAASLKYISGANSTTQPTFTVNLAPYYNLSVSTNPIVANPFGIILVHMDEDDPTL